MNLNHLNLTVKDVPATRAFLMKYFGMQEGGGNDNLAFLRDENGIVLTLMSMKFGKETELKYPGVFHIGFIQDSEERVNEINAQMKADGYDVPAPSRQHNSWTFYVMCPGGFLVEVLA
jgi:catechol-2,3-dioxygenase